LVGLGFELKASCLQSRCSAGWSIPLVHFCSGYFGDGISWTIFSDWPQTAILSISASQVAKIIGLSWLLFHLLTSTFLS
jgi:hypothetical protein